MRREGHPHLRYYLIVDFSPGSVLHLVLLVHYCNIVNLLLHLYHPVVYAVVMGDLLFLNTARSSLNANISLAFSLLYYGIQIEINMRQRGKSHQSAS